MYIGTGIGNTRFICKLEDIQLLGGGADVIKRQGLQSWLVYIVQKLLFCGTMNYEKAKYFSTMKRVLSILTDIYIFMSQHLKRIGCKVFDAQSLEQLIEVE